MLISLHKAIECAIGLNSGRLLQLGAGVTVRLIGQRMVICELGNEVCWFETVTIVNGVLILDRCKTAIEERRRGWAKLGLLIALRYGMAQGATVVQTGTEVEQKTEALALWGRIQKDVANPIQPEIVRIMKSIPMNVQPTQTGRSVYEIRDRVATGSSKKAIVRSGSMSKLM